MIRAQTLLWVTVSLLAASCAARKTPSPADHVIVVSIDGLRPDAIQRAPACTLLSLMGSGAHCPAGALNVLPSETLPNHVSMLTGLVPERHGIDWDEFRPEFVRVPTVFSRVKEAGGSTAVFHGKPKFAVLARPGTVDFLFGPPPGSSSLDPATTAPRIAESFARAWGRRRFRFAFVHLREPDTAGHLHGWMSEEYLRAVRAADEALAAILQTVRDAGAWERTAVIVSSDHGGHSRDHADDVPENRAIPWICVGPPVSAGACIDRILRTVDTAATALWFLGLPTDGLDGRPVEFDR